MKIGEVHVQQLPSTFICIIEYFRLIPFTNQSSKQWNDFNTILYILAGRRVSYALGMNLYLEKDDKNLKLFRYPDSSWLIMYFLIWKSWAQTQMGAGKFETWTYFWILLTFFVSAKWACFSLKTQHNGKIKNQNISIFNSKKPVGT